MVLPIPAPALFQQGLRLYQQGQSKAAKEILMQALSVSGNDVKILSSLGVVCKHLGEYQQAERYYQQGIAADEHWNES